MVFKEIFVFLVVTVLVIDGRTINSPMSYEMHRSKYSPISYDIVRPMASVIKPMQIKPALKPMTKVKPSKLRKRASRKSENEEASENLIKIVRRMRQNYTETEMRILATVGLISGSLNVEEAMRENLNRLADEYHETFDKMSTEQSAKKAFSIEEAMNRDKLASKFLASALKFAREVINIDDFQKDMKRLKNEVNSCSYDANEI